MDMSRTDDQVKYYIKFAWWILKLSIIIFLLIPGTVPMILGFLGSLVYRLVDPEYILLNSLLDLYYSTINTWPILVQILFYKVIVLTFVLPYVYFIRKKYPSMNIIEISKYQVESQVRRLKKPENPKSKPMSD